MAYSRPKAVGLKKPVVATDLRLGGSSERAVGFNGELNASSRKDLMVQIAKMMEVAATQHIETEETALTKEQLASQHKEMILAAFQDKDAHKELGEVLSQELYQAANREGFMRRFLTRQEVTQGSIPYVRMRMKDQIATVASAPIQVMPQIVRDNFFFPPEFYINARPFVEQREIEQSADDVLEEKFVEGLEGIMVQEDRTWKALADSTVNTANPLTTISGLLSPYSLAQLRNTVNQWDIPTSSCLIASDIWNDIIGNQDFAYVIDPVSKHDLLVSGQLGTMFGMTIYTDAYRYLPHKVLNEGDIYILGAAVNHGQYTDRGGINSQPVDGSIEHIPGRGWWLTELVSIIVANSSSVAKGKRVIS